MWCKSPCKLQRVNSRWYCLHGGNLSSMNHHVNTFYIGELRFHHLECCKQGSLQVRHVEFIEMALFVFTWELVDDT